MPLSVYPPCRALLCSLSLSLRFVWRFCGGRARLWPLGSGGGRAQSGGKVTALGTTAAQQSRCSGGSGLRGSPVCGHSRLAARGRAGIVGDAAATAALVWAWASGLAKVADIF
jgi:hypothetical protein